jgi:glyoxylase-like metal-dependent hydrolase (beta-lactamase superfamily II)
LPEYKKEFACPVITPTDEKPFTIGDFKISPLLCPGHALDCVVYLITTATDPIPEMFTGDVLFAETIGRTDLQPNGFAEMQTTLRRLADVKFANAHHGHYQSTSFAAQQKNIRRFLK